MERGFWVHIYSRLPKHVPYSSETNGEITRRNIDANRNMITRQTMQGIEMSNIFNMVVSQLLMIIAEQLRLFKPKLLFLSFDGVHVPSKVVTQLKRRVRSYNKSVEKLKGKSEAVIRDQMVYQYEISPDTELMEHICQKIKSEIKRLQTFNKEEWQTLDVIISDTKEKGEGEFKILLFIKNYMCGRNHRHAIFVLDTDVQLMAVAIPEQNIFTYYYEDIKTKMGSLS